MQDIELGNFLDRGEPDAKMISICLLISTNMLLSYYADGTHQPRASYHRITLHIIQSYHETTVVICASSAMGKVSAILPVLKGSVMQSQPQPVVIVQSRIQSVMQQVYLWMTAGLLLTGAISSMLANNEALLGIVLNPIVFIGLFVVELGLVLAISAFINKMSPALATGLFILYAGLNGITLTPILLTYTAASVATAFFTTAGMFAALALYGTVTKRDLSGMGKFLMMALFGLLIATIVNIFLRSSGMDFVISIFGVLIFAGLTAYDTQRLNQIASQAMSEDEIGRFSIMGALTLYLDFINLFLYLLRLLGRRND